MTQRDMERVKRAVIRKYPIFASVALFNVPIEEDNKISTAEVYAEKLDNGDLKLKGIKYNPDFFDNLSFEQQVFVLAHETCHIAFKHFLRSIEKPEKDVERKYKEYCEIVFDQNLRKIEKVRLHRKYHNFWNIATDACINAFLVKDGLEMPEGVIDKKTGQPMHFINIKDGLYRSAEFIYDSLVKEDEKREEEKKNDKSNQEDGNSQNSVSSGDGSLDDNGSMDPVSDWFDDFDIDNYQGIDSHDNWNGEEEEIKKENNKDKDEENDEKGFKKSILDKFKDLMNKENGSNQEENEKDIDSSEQDDAKDRIDETDIFRQNEIERNNKENKSFEKAMNNIIEEIGMSNSSNIRPILSWKYLLIRSLEEDVEKWGYRRANKHMPNARVEDRTEDIKSVTEIILDTSGSVSDDLLKEFLRQLIPLFKETKIKVGCFCGDFHGFSELNSVKQIEEFKAIRDGGGTNFEAAVTAFSKDNSSVRINKIVFTDGELDIIPGHIQKTPVDGILWIVFGNKMDFRPLGGKIIKINEKDLNQMLSVSDVFSNDQVQDIINNNEKIRRR